MRPALLLVITLLLLLPACARPEPAKSEDPLARLRAKGELVWGGDIQGGEPYVFEDEKDPGKLVGFEVEIADAVARRLGVRARFWPNDWSSLVPALERGDFDVVMNGLEATPERTRELLLSRPYFAFAETLAVRRGDPATTLDAMVGRKVATLNQTLAFRTLSARPDIDRKVYEGVREPYDDLELGRVDGVLLENIIADRYGCNRPTIACIPQEALKGVYVIGMRRGEEALKVAIDAALDAMTRDGELRAILERWHIWDARQADLDAIAADSSSARAPAGRGLDRAQLQLFVQGAAITLAISVSAFALAIPVGLGLAIARVYGGKVSRFFAGAYIEVFRGTPVLLQLYVLYFGISTVVRLPPIAAAVLGLGLNYAAYEAEVYRGALSALPRGQTEAASALGLTRLQALRHVLMPQALRNALPAMTNDFVALLKDSSLVSVISVVELTKRMTIASVEIGTWLAPGLACAALYFAMSYPLARLSRRLEKRLARDPDPRFA